MKKITIAIILTLIIVGAVGALSFYNYGSKKSQSKNSTVTTNLPDISDQTTKEAIKKQVTFAIAGDIMLDRNVWHNYKDIGLSRILDDFDTDLFKNSDISLVNLEGPISQTAIDDDCCSGSMIFNFPPEAIDFLKYAGIKEVSLANNHTYNAGKQNFVYTQNILINNGIKNFGRQIGFNQKEDILRLDTQIPISIIGLDALAEYIPKEITDAIKQEKATGRFVIIFPHWGTEYQSSSHNTSQASLAKTWADAGANLIIGSHPHVVQDTDIIGKTPVIYSLGNFIFDQYFSEETQQGVLLTGKITQDKIEITFNPFQSTKSRPSLITGTKKQNFIKNILKLTPDTISVEY